MFDYLIIIQARPGGNRLPGKVFMTVKGIPMVKRVWIAARAAMSGRKAKVVVAWPERYSDLDENNVLERFRRLSLEFPSKWIIRLTADCPLLTSEDINNAINYYNNNGCLYWSNHSDGHDVQIFDTDWFHTNNNHKHIMHKEHVIADFRTKSIGLSVNTLEDLFRVRQLAK